jgi:hypothetical protein
VYANFGKQALRLMEGKSQPLFMTITGSGIKFPSHLQNKTGWD